MRDLMLSAIKSVAIGFRRWGIVLLSVFALASCDARIIMAYSVHNKSAEEVKIFVPAYPRGASFDAFGEYTDTMITLKPKEKVTVGYNEKLDFPWATKNIYRKTPGICGLQIVRQDTSMKMGCTENEWEYKKRESILKIK